MADGAVLRAREPGRAVPGGGALDLLIADHRDIARVLDALSRAANETPLDPKRVAAVLEALLGLEALHHDREELLWCALGRARPILRDGPLRTLRAEHAALLASGERALEAVGHGAARRQARAAASIAASASARMAREESNLFWLARRVLTETEQRELGRAILAHRERTRRQRARALRRLSPPA